MLLRLPGEGSLLAGGNRGTWRDQCREAEKDDSPINDLLCVVQMLEQFRMLHACELALPPSYYCEE